MSSTAASIEQLPKVAKEAKEAKKNKSEKKDKKDKGEKSEKKDKKDKKEKDKSEKKDRKSRKASTVTTLSEWAALYPKKGLRFDALTREPSVYDGDGDDATKIKSIPWNHEADIVTVLSNPTQYPVSIYETALSRFREYSENAKKKRMGIEERLRNAERDLIGAWREYNAEPIPSRGRDDNILFTNIQAAENNVRILEAALFTVRDYDVEEGDDDSGGGGVLRDIREIKVMNGGSGIYEPPMPINERGFGVPTVMETL